MQVETKYSIGDVVYRGRVESNRLVLAYGPYTISGVSIKIKTQDDKEVQSVNYTFVGYSDLAPEERLFTSGVAAFKHYEKELNKDKE